MVGVASSRPAQPSEEIVLEFSDVIAGYGTVTVLRDVNLKIPRGSVVAMLGANGAGKTTSLRVAAGLVPSTSGRVTLEGVDITSLRTSQRALRGLCLIPDGRGIYASLTVHENLRLHLPRGTHGAEIEAALVAFPALSGRLNQVAGSLSGGEQQMLALSRAYVTAPRVVLLDEVSTGLAPLVVAEIFDALSGLASLGTSLLIVEQYVAKALELADYACLLERGRLTWLGPAADVDEASIAQRYLGGKGSS